MKKIFTFIAAALMTVSANAQTPQILTEVEPNTFAVTMTNDEIAEKFDAQWCADAWNIGVALPAGTVMADNNNLTISAAVTTPVYTANGKISDMKKEFPDYTGYINLGSTLANNNWEGAEQIFEASSIFKNGQGIVSVTPKVDGVLKFGVYAGDNSREIGIYLLATTDEQIDNEDFGWVAMNNFRNDGENGTVASAPAYVEGAVKAGREYLLIGGGSTNLTLHQISFVAGETGISSAIIENTAKSNVMYNLAGQRIAAPVSGQIYILNGKKYIAK